MKLPPCYGRAEDRVRTEQLHRRIDRSAARADESDNTVCTCEWITALDVCPNCGCVRMPDKDGAP